MPSQDIGFELFYDGAWHDLVVVDDVLTAPITIRRGQGDESPAPRPSQISARLANDDDRYRTSNPESPLYGKAGRNTPTRVAVGGNVRGLVEASSWVCGQTRDFRPYPRRGKAWTDFEGGGLLQRIGQWSEPLKSPFRQYNEGITQAIGYFHAEQARGSTALLSTVPGTRRQGGFTGVAFDSQYRPPGSAPLMDIGDGAGLGYFFAGAGAASAGSTAGWQLSWAGRYEPLAPGEQTIMYWKTADTTAGGLYLNPSSGEMLIYTSLGGVPVIASGTSYSSYDWTQWTLFSMDVQYSAGTTTIWVNWTNADNSQSGFMNKSFTGVPSALTWWSVLGGAGEVPAGSTMGHVIGVNERSSGSVDLFGSARRAAWTGHLRELAPVRFARLCTQLGIAYAASPGYLSSSTMGAQPVATFAEHLREIATTDDALIVDYRDISRLYMFCRADRYNQTPALTLTPQDLPSLPDEVTDDLPVHNLVTVSRRDGGEATAQDSTGPLGTQAPPDGVGQYRQNVEINIDDEGDLPQYANYWLRRGTVDLPRYPQVTVNLAALSAAKVAEVEGVEVGTVIEITGFRENTIRLHVLGYTETIGTHSRRVVFVCAADQQFDVGAYDTDRRYDSASTSLAEGLTAGETIWDIRTVNPADCFSSTMGYDVDVGGERCRPRSVTAPVLSGGYWTQTMTCTRSINGVVKTHNLGDPIHVHRAQVARYAL